MWCTTLRYSIKPSVKMTAPKERVRSGEAKMVPMTMGMPTTAAYAVAAAQGDATLAPPIAGEAVGLIHDVPGAAEIVERMATEAEARLKGGRQR